MPNTLTIFRKFNDLELAQRTADILNEHGIEYLLEKSPEVFDVTMGVRNELSDEFVVKVHADDYERAYQAMSEHEKEFIDEVDTDYYLYSFTDQELIAVIYKRNEWSDFDYELAKKLLTGRGYNPDELETLHLRNAEAQPPTEASIQQERRSNVAFYIIIILAALAILAYRIFFTNY